MNSRPPRLQFPGPGLGPADPPADERKGAEEEACDRQVRGHLLTAQLAEAFQLCFW